MGHLLFWGPTALFSHAPWRFPEHANDRQQSLQFPRTDALRAFDPSRTLTRSSKRRHSSWQAGIMQGCAPRPRSIHRSPCRRRRFPPPGAIRAGRADNRYVKVPKRHPRLPGAACGRMRLLCAPPSIARWRAHVRAPLRRRRPPFGQRRSKARGPMRKSGQLAAELLPDQHRPTSNRE